MKLKHKPKGKKRPRKWHHGPAEDDKFTEIDSQLPWPATTQEHHGRAS